MKRYLLLFLLILSVAGCGSSDRDPYARVPAAPTSPAPGTATVELRSVLAQTAVPSYITTIRGSGFASSGERIYGPQERSKAATVRWTDVPVETRTFLFEFLDANGRVLGNGTAPVRLTDSQVFLVDDLTVAFDPNPTPDPEPTPEPTPDPTPEPTPEPDLRLETDQDYSFNTDTGVISPPLDGSSVPAGWNPEKKEFEINTFTLEPGAVLNVTGNTALSLKVQGDVVVDGTLQFSGADGEDAEDTEFPTADTTSRAASVVAQAVALDFTAAAGANGADGGISVSALGQISGSGSVLTNGGKGGRGGNIRYTAADTIISSTITAGRGGNGGAAGRVTLLGAPGSVLVGLTIVTAPGNGGDGGSIEFPGAASLIDATGEVFGGRGGDANGEGGLAGNGGNVTFSNPSRSVYNASIVTGGAGGTGEFQGGAGGNVTVAGFNGINDGTMSGGAGGASSNYGGQGGSVLYTGQFATNNNQRSLLGGQGGAGGFQGGAGGGIVLSGSGSASYGLTTGGKGGDGGTLGGNGGSIDFSGPNGFNNTNATATGGEGGSGGLVGGDGGDVLFSVRNVGAATGGAGGDATDASGFGGAGGDVVFRPNADASGTKTGGAAGNPGGSPGTVVGP